MINFIKNKKNIILSSSIFSGINSNIFCADENKKNIEIIVKYNGFEYKASNIEVTKDNFAVREQRIEFIKNNKDKFISGENKLNFKDSIIEKSIIGKFDDGYKNSDGKDEFEVVDLSDGFSNLLKATITIEDSAELKYIRTNKKFKFQRLEDMIENGIVKFFNRQKKEIDTKNIIGKIKVVIKSKCNIDVNDDIFIFDKNADENGIIKESCTLKINFPDSLIEGNPDPKPTDPTNKDGSSSKEDKKAKPYCGS